MFVLCLYTLTQFPQCYGEHDDDYAATKIKDTLCISGESLWGSKDCYIQVKEQCTVDSHSRHLWWRVCDAIPLINWANVQLQRAELQMQELHVEWNLCRTGLKHPVPGRPTTQPTQNGNRSDHEHTYSFWMFSLVNICSVCEASVKWHQTLKQGSPTLTWMF